MQRWFVLILFDDWHVQGPPRDFCRSVGRRMIPERIIRFNSNPSCRHITFTVEVTSPIIQDGIYIVS